jgi:hypothetical protein
MNTNNSKTHIMKNYMPLFVFIFVLFSCSNDDDNQMTTEPELIGNWKLIEVYADPGDGSGDFMAVDSNKTVNFGTDNIISSNGNLCFMSIESDSPTEGLYSEEEQTFSIADCGIVPFSSSFQIVDSNLIINYPCIEACQEKYVKIAND